MLQTNRSATVQSTEQLSSGTNLESEFTQSRIEEVVCQALERHHVGTAPHVRNAEEGIGERGSFRFANGEVSFPPPMPPPPQKPSLHALQEWEGYVVEINENDFVARLVDLTAGKSHETEEATIPLDEISERDAANLRIGGIFRWVIGYERSREGTRRRVSHIVFRDLPRMMKGDFQAGEEWADKIATAFNSR